MHIIRISGTDTSLGVILNVADIGDVAGQLVETDFVDEVAAHGVQEV